MTSKMSNFAHSYMYCLQKNWPFCTSRIVTDNSKSCQVTVNVNVVTVYSESIMTECLMYEMCYRSPHRITRPMSAADRRATPNLYQQMSEPAKKITKVCAIS